jgi:hypothetical protein
MGDLLTLLDDPHFVTGVERVMIHPSLFNPFAFFGPGMMLELYSGIGLPLLVVCWWGCYISISTLLNLARTRSVLETALLVVGGLSMLAIHRFRAAMLGRLQKLSSPYVKQLKSPNRVSSLLGILVALAGFVLFFLMQWHLWRK